MIRLAGGAWRSVESCDSALHQLDFHMCLKGTHDLQRSTEDWSWRGAGLHYSWLCDRQRRHLVRLAQRQ